MSNIEIPLNTRNRPIQITVDKNVYSCKFENETTEYWNEHSDYVPSKNEIVVFSDYITTLIGQNIPGIKIGDGSTNVINLPFANSSTGGEFIRALEEHEANDVVHTTQAEKDIWNGKADADDLANHTANAVVHTTQAEKDIWNGKADISVVANGLVITLPS